MRLDPKTVEACVRRVEKPTRYIGNEMNIVRKAPADCDVRVALAFPDVYDVGMSYTGFKILYERINAVPNYSAERVFAPWPDFAAQLREKKIPLFSLENYSPLADFDLIGFTLQSEMNFTNVLNMLDLAGLPVERREQTSPFPLVIAGGHGAFSPEPLAPFIDAFVIGDGEEVILEIMELVEHMKKRGFTKREDYLLALAHIQGVYVPRFFEFDYNEDSTIAKIRSTEESVAPIVWKRHYDLTRDDGTTRPIVALTRVIHDRITIEIKRGCTQGCRFCQAGMITRPVKERTPDDILRIAKRNVLNTGYRDISLLSLSTADYTCIADLVKVMMDEFAPRSVAISLPSMRISSFDVGIAAQISRVRKTGFTFAPEAGSERLRRVINKFVDQQEFYKIIEEVFTRGWKTIKMYFMIGLPTETDADLDGIIELAREAESIGKRIARRNFQINITISPFVPKAQTPYQWHGQPPIAEMHRKYNYVRSRLNSRYIDVKTGNPDSSLIEAVLARGDRKVSAAVKRAWELGCQFDGWSEHFRFDRWLRAFEETAVDPVFYANRERGKDETLPWYHVEAALGVKFLWSQKMKSDRELIEGDCSIFKCLGCKVCNDTLDHSLAKDRWKLGERPNAIAESAAQKTLDDIELPPVEDKGLPPVQRLRLRYTKRGLLKFLSHLDLIRVLNMIMSRAGVPVAFTQGFHPQPKMQYSPPLSLGFESEDEVADVFLVREMVAEELLRALNECTIKDLEFVSCESVPLRSDSVEKSILASEFEVIVKPAMLGSPTATRNAIEDLAECYRSGAPMPIKISKKNRVIERDAREGLEEFCVSGVDESGIKLALKISQEDGNYINPLDLLGGLLGKPLCLGEDLDVRRARILLAPQTVPVSLAKA